MIEHETEMKLATSLVLMDVIDKMLNNSDNLPFRLKYRLTRTSEQLRHDYEKYNSACLYLKAHYGKPNEDNTDVVLDDISKENYNKAINNILMSTVSHRLFTVEPDDLDTIKSVIDIPVDELRTFIAIMTNDETLKNEIENEIKLTQGE